LPLSSAAAACEAVVGGSVLVGEALTAAGVASEATPAPALPAAVRLSLDGGALLGDFEARVGAATVAGGVDPEPVVTACMRTRSDTDKRTA
jgi:hypothetical protein